MFGFFSRRTSLRLRKDLDELRLEFDGLLAAHQTLRESFNRLQGKLARRGELKDPDGAPVVASPSPGQPALSGRAAEIQRSILSRRGLHVSNGG